MASGADTAGVEAEGPRARPPRVDAHVRDVRTLGSGPRWQPDPEVPTSLAARDLARVSHSIANAAGMAVLTMTAGISAVGVLIAVAIGLAAVPFLTGIFEPLMLFIAWAGFLMVCAALFIGLLHFVLPRALQVVLLLLRSPWFLPSTVISAPMAALWRVGALWSEPWETAVAPHGLAARWSFRSRRYAGTVDGRPLEVRQDIVGGALELIAEVPRTLPAVYVGPEKIAGPIGVVRALVRCPALTNSEILLRDGRLVIRRRWLRPNLQQLTTLVSRMCEEHASGGLLAELQTLSLLADWRQLKTPRSDRWTSPWFESPAVGRHLEGLRRRLRASPPTLLELEAILADGSVREPAKAWLMWALVHRLNAEQAAHLVRHRGEEREDPTVGLTAAGWPAWIAVHRLTLEGGPEALGPLQSFISSTSVRSPLLRAARRAVVRIIQRNGGVHTLTGHLSMVDGDGGQLALTAHGDLSEVPPEKDA